MNFKKKLSKRILWVVVALMSASLSIGSHASDRSIVVLGDSLSAGYGMSVSEGWVSLLAKKLKARCGTGGTIKDGVVEIQGEHRDLLMTELEKLGYKVRRSGG